MAIDTMTAESVALALGSEPGYYIVGEFLGVDPEREYTDRRTNTRKMSRPRVRLLVGGHIEAIGFRDLASVEATIGEPEARSIIAVPVYLNGPWDEESNRPMAHNAQPSGRPPRSDD